MIRAVGNKRLELSSSEYSYYKTLKEKFGESEFAGLFITDKNGIINSITPPVDTHTPIGIVYFILNVMMNQRIRMLDFKISEIKKEKVDQEDAVPNIAERLARIEAAVFDGEL